MENKKGSVKKVVLAYSGGLDTSVIIRWLIENYGCEVIAFTADLGQGEELKPLRKKAIQTGASKIVITDLREEFVKDFVIPAIKANLLYEGKYPMATSLGRPLIAKWLVDICKQENGDAIAHGCTGKGNDQVRLEMTAFALAPHLKTLAPVREWELMTREEEIDYAKKWNIPVPVTKAKPYSLDKNLYGTSIECGVLEDPWNEPPDNTYIDIQPLSKTPNQPEDITIGFTQGTPDRLNGKKIPTLKLIETLSKLACKHGVGRIDLVENRLVGIKSREVYEAPAATVLIAAHRELECVTLDRDTQHFKDSIIPRYAELVYNGQWYTPLRSALAQFVEETQKCVTGEVKIRLFKGNCIPVARKSPYSLYDKSLATYEKGDVFNRNAAVGFIEIFGLPMRTIARVREKNEKK